jgi:dihydrofolate synthase/folylpolyglutamate synthase
MGFLAFRELGVEVAVVEVGLGSRLDATNIVPAELTAITPVDYDHETYLGYSLPAIAGEKAGILKAGVPVVFARQRIEALEVLRARAAELDVPVSSTADWRVSDLTLDARGSHFAARGPDGSLQVDCPLAGEHQVENALTAAVTLRSLGIEAGPIEAGIARTSWPGRLEVVSEAPEIVLDGAHNPAGVRALSAYVQRFYAGRSIWVVYGAMRDKSLDEIAGILSPVAERIIVTTPNSHRALRQQEVERFFDHPEVEVAPDTRQALDRASEAPPGAAVFVTGSLLLVGEVTSLLGV